MGHRAVSVVTARGGGVMIQELLLQIVVVAVVPGLRGRGG